MQFRSFIIACALGLALLLYAERRPAARPQEGYSQVMDLTRSARVKADSQRNSGTRIISPAAMIPGTWGAAQIPAERLIAPLVVMDLNASSAQISVNDITNWEAKHGSVPQGAIVAVRRAGPADGYSSDLFPMSTDAVQFLMDARYTRGFIIETPANLGVDRTLSRQIALHGNYIIEKSTPLAALPETGSLVIVAPEKDNQAAESPVRVLAMIPPIPSQPTKPAL
jgi:kynurenine formamidase